MSKTVAAAFSRYQSDIVDLAPEDSDGARSSRDYLVAQIVGIADSVNDFPVLYDGGYYLPFGSFARKTKTQLLDDVDLMHVIHGCSGTAIWLSQYKYAVKICNNQLPLWNFADDDYVNSTKILNKFKTELMNVPNYSSTEIKKSGEAVVVNLSSYDWSFDVVPAFAVSDGAGGVGHFLIPDGQGNWKRTDPRSDQEQITKANQYHNGCLLPLIRVMKYWNDNSRHAQRIGSYHLETMLINGFWAYQPLQNVKSGVITAFKILQSSIMSSCPDPKGLDVPLDKDLDLLQRLNFATAAGDMANRLSNVTLSEALGMHEGAIKVWQEVFPDFPGYKD